MELYAWYSEKQSKVVPCIQIIKLKDGRLVKATMTSTTESQGSHWDDIKCLGYGELIKTIPNPNPNSYSYYRK
jgi:hypothetical protein